MAAVAQLKALLGIDNAQYKAGMRDSEGAAKRFQSSIASIGRTLGIAFSAGAIINMTRKLIDFASEIRHTADNLNVTTDTLQGLNAMALRYGVSVDMIGRALWKMLIAQDGVAKGDKRYLDALKALNIDAEKFINLDSAGAMEAIGRGYANASDQSAAFAAVADLLGERIGPRLIAMMKDLGNDGLQTVIDKAKEAGSVIEDQLITKLELLGTRNDQIALRVKVGWAQALDKIATAAKSIGAAAGQGQAEIDAMTSGKSRFNPVRNIKNIGKWAFSGGIKRSIEAGGREINGQASSTSSATQQIRTLASERKTNFFDPMMASSMDDYKKALADAAREQKRIADIAAINTKYGQRISEMQAAPFSATGRDIRHDSMAAMGGFIGGSRAGVGTADKQLQIMIEQNRRDQQEAQMRKQQADDIASIADSATGGSPQ